LSEYYIRQNLLASNSRTIVKDKTGKPLFLLIGRWGTRGDVLSLYDMSGQLIAKIKQATFALKIGSRFDLYLHFEKVGSLQRVLSFQRDFYIVHGLGWVVIGDIPNHRYTIQHYNQQIMQMTKASTIYGDYYCLMIDKEEDAPLCICIAAVLDYWLLNRKTSKEKFKNFLPNISTN